jgi:hypothetical protein
MQRTQLEGLRLKLKSDLLLRVAPLDRGAAAPRAAKLDVEALVAALAEVNPTPQPAQSPLSDGRWNVVYTTSAQMLGLRLPDFLRPSGPLYLSFNAAEARAGLDCTWPLKAERASMQVTSPTGIALGFESVKLFRIIPLPLSKSREYSQLETSACPSPHLSSRITASLLHAARTVLPAVTAALTHALLRCRFPQFTWTWTCASCAAPPERCTCSSWTTPATRSATKTAHSRARCRRGAQAGPAKSAARREAGGAMLLRRESRRRLWVSSSQGQTLHTRREARAALRSGAPTSKRARAGPESAPHK